MNRCATAGSGATERDTRDDRESMLDAMLALAEQAMRACVEAGAGPALAARATRVLGEHLAEQRRQEEHADPLDAVALSRVLKCLQDARTGRLTAAGHAANMLARNDVVRAMRTLNREAA